VLWLSLWHSTKLAPGASASRGRRVSFWYHSTSRSYVLHDTCQKLAKRIVSCAQPMQRPQWFSGYPASLCTKLFTNIIITDLPGKTFLKYLLSARALICVRWLNKLNLNFNLTPFNRDINQHDMHYWRRMGGEMAKINYIGSRPTLKFNSLTM